MLQTGSLLAIALGDEVRMSVIKRIGCLSYVPLGYGTPQVQYLMRSLAAHYGTVTPIGLISPRWNSHAPQDDGFPDFSICYFSPEEEHRVALATVVPELIRWIKVKGLSRIGIYGAGEHTRGLRALWNTLDGPPITTLITSETPVEGVVDGLPTVCVHSLAPGALDIVVLSSGLFEKDMAATIGQYRPEIPFVALHNPGLSRFGTRLKLPESLSPKRITRYRDSRVARWIDAFKPDLLVCTHYTLLGAILNAKHRPEHIIYYALEFGGTDGNPVTQEIIDHHRELASRITLVLCPEPNRMRHYQEDVGFKEVPSKVIFNSRPAAISHQRSDDERNGRVLIQGSLSAKLTYIDYLARRTAPEPPIDVFGLTLDHDPAHGILRDSALGVRNGFSYSGLVSTQRLTQMRPSYAYVLVMWNPGSFDGRFACPNKFFEAIIDGVPPIVAPHPQCKEIVEKYDCGILLRDWSFEAFEDGLKRARDIYGTPRYRELVDNCRRAAAMELSWERQFESLVPLLPPRRTPQRQKSRRRLLLLDPTLRTEAGHHFHYAQHVLAGAANLGVETVAGVSRDCEVDLDKADRIYPLYQHDFWGRDTSFREMPVAKDSSARFVETTRRILDSERFGSGDDIFIPNISDADLAALTDFIYRCRAAYRWHIIIRHDLPDNSSLRVESLRRLQGLGGGSSVFFYTDTPELADQHHAAADVPFTVLPIPVTTAPARRSRRKPVHDGIRVVYPGDARSEKGYTSLPALVRTCADLVSKGSLKFIIQANAPGDTACELATVKLASYSTGVQLIRRHLSAIEYERMLRSADVVLALYDPQRYTRRSSHVVAEALCSGTPVLVQRGTAPAGMLPADSPWLCDDVDEAARALRMFVAHPQREMTRARQLQRSLAESHNGTRLAEILIQNIRDESSLSVRTSTLELRHL